MPDKKRNLFIAGGIALMLLISISLAVYSQKPAKPPESAAADAQGDSGSPISTDSSIPGAKITMNNADSLVQNNNPAAGATTPSAPYTPFKPPAGEAKRVTLDTDKGQIVVEVYPQAMPKTVDNFLKLVNSKFYNGLKFHRVEDWVVQGGDPKGDGTGGPGWSIPLEKDPPELKNVRGALAMARSSDPNSAGSQFYILKRDTLSLDGGYAVFGQVVKGMEIVDQIQGGDKMKTVAPVN